jgi:hypothetical protein
MPIRRDLRGLYPANWAEVSRIVRFERAEGRCQVCRRPHGYVIRCLADGRWYDPQMRTWRTGKGRPCRWPDLMEAFSLRTTKVILAAAHVNHNPARNGWRNLKSLCQRCHMIHDRPYHLAERRLTHLRRYASGDLFLGPYPMQSARKG